MGHVLKAYVGAFLTPTTFLEILLIIGFILLIRKKSSAKYFIFSALGTLILFGTNPLPEYLLNKYEMQYPAFKLSPGNQDAKYVVVLAGGIVPSKVHPITTQLTSTTLTRVIEGIKIYREIPGSKLVVTGNGWADVPEAQMMKQMAISLGVKEEDIIAELESENTFDHTVYLKKIIGSEKFILVTSALHLPRAMRMFQATGYKPIPAPTHHILTGDYKSFNVLYPFTEGTNLAAMDALFKEYSATILAELKGQI